MSKTRQQIRGDKERGNGISRISAVANYFIKQSKKEKRPVSNLSMQKLVYFAYGWMLVQTEKKLFYDRIEAWQYGPVIPSLYHQLKHYGRGRITKEILDYNHEKDKFYRWNLTEGTNVEKIMQKVWKRYKSLTPGEMIDLTHNPGTPWHNTILSSGYNAVIDDELIKAHFLSLENENSL